MSRNDDVVLVVWGVRISWQNCVHIDYASVAIVYMFACTISPHSRLDLLIYECVSMLKRGTSSSSSPFLLFLWVSKLLFVARWREASVFFTLHTSFNLNHLTVNHLLQFPAVWQMTLLHITTIMIFSLPSVSMMIIRISIEYIRVSLAISATFCWYT